jgi:uncharacterized C2H2 Zn-finger protein
VAKKMAGRGRVGFIPLEALTDCMYFVMGVPCKYGNRCRFRHCLIAAQQNKQCKKWPHSCTNVNCPYRHGSTPIDAEKSPQFSPPYSITMPSSSSFQKQDQKSQEGIISIFWDLENVQIPRAQKPFDIIQRIRQMLVISRGLHELGFTCYCDVATISKINQLSLTHANVRISHVPDRKPGGVDRQILLDLDRFERAHRPPATIVLISGDIDFVGKLADLRHQAHFEVIVIHNKPAKQELKATVNEHYSWDIFTSSNLYPLMADARTSLQISSSPGAPPSYLSLPAKSLVACPQCTSEFESKYSLQQHQIAKQHLFDCSLCDERFFTFSAQINHQKSKRHRQTEDYSCADCNKSFRTSKSLEQHENATGHGAEISSSPDDSNTPSADFNCSKCNIQYPNFGIFLAHFILHAFD